MTFLLRLIRSRFGLYKIRRLFTGGRAHGRVVAMIKNGRIPATRKDLQDLLGLPVLLDTTEVPLLQAYAEKAQRVIVEIGAAYGGSSLNFLLSKNPHVRVYSIDPFIVDSMASFQATKEKCVTHVSKALADASLKNRIQDWTVLADYSYNVVRDWQEPIDVIFIDGDHTYDAVRKDFEDWLPHVVDGGYILFHDSCKEQGTPEGTYNKGWPGPTQIANELETDSRVETVERTHSISVFRKKNA